MMTSSQLSASIAQNWNALSSQIRGLLFGLHIVYTRGLKQAFLGRQRGPYDRRCTSKGVNLPEQLPLYHI